MSTTKGTIEVERVDSYCSVCGERQSDLFALEAGSLNHTTMLRFCRDCFDRLFDVILEARKAK